MNSYHNILNKLSQFTSRYYSKMLVKGILLFLAFGLLFFMVILGVEYTLWLNSNGRLILLMIFVAVELFLFFKYIATPLFYLFKLKKGISNKEASVFIGKHFPEVGDKLYNLLDLAEDPNQSELLLASMEQRSKKLDPIPFTKAINFKESLKYAKYLSIPALIFGLIWLSGNLSSFFGSYDRVVNYDLAYEPPAPFRFELISNTLEVLENEAHTIQVVTEGSIKPESVYIKIEGKSFLLQEQDGLYQYTFTPPLKQTQFYFEANDIQSQTYELKALRTPSIQNFNVVLNYPNYTGKKTETLKSTGNAIVPEGTKVSWEIAGLHTDRIRLVTKDTAISFRKEKDRFLYTKRVYGDLSYQLATSNKNVTDYEKLDYKLTVIKDGYPSIKANQVKDSLSPNVLYFSGEATDDYQLTNIRLVCYPEEEAANTQTVAISKPTSNFDQFYYTFPSGLQLEAGRNYSFYFEARDNDAIHGGKAAKSQIFSMALLDDNQLKNKQLEFQQSILNNLDKSLEKFKEQKETLKEINKEQKEKKNLSFNDQNQIKDFLKKQQQQENLMQKFSKQLKENLEKGNKDDELNQLLKERLERQELEAKKNERLLEELNKIADKINKEELAKRLEELGKKQQNSERSLEQLVELTKRYYVTEKAAQLAKDLEKLAEKQEGLSKQNAEEAKPEEQEKLNEAFEELAKELEELKKDNQGLQKPLDLKIEKKKEEAVKEDQEKALEKLKEQEKQASKSEEQQNQAAQKQKSAADKMKQMSEQLAQSSSASGGGSSITEDAEMLRQILDNLITFSFKQEQLFDQMQEADEDIAQFSSSVRKQQELRNLFEHVDDSLFALSLRRAELSEFVNEQITEVYYNTDKALERLAERQIYQGARYQQGVVTASNSLADFLAKLLDNMQQNMQSGSGSGQSSEGFQLPDIIKGQGELQKKMGEMGESSGSQGKPQQGEGKSESGEDGEKGESGNKAGKNGQQGQGERQGQGEGEGQQGEGNSGKEGSNGKNGKEGKGSGNGGQGQGEPSEEELKEIYEIYKEQQVIRQRLEQQLQDMIRAGDKQLAQKLVKQMEDFENDLLENGITQRTMSKVNNIQHQLMKLENASLKQGKKSERESNANKDAFKNPITTKPLLLDNYRNEVEILNRQALPLQQIFRNKVKNYFKTND